MKLQKLLVPVDFSLGSEMAFKYAEFLAKKFSSSIHLIHVVDKRYVEKIAELNGEPEDEVSEKLCSLANEKLDGFLTHNKSNGLIAGKKISVGTPFQAIALRAQTIDADMIVMGGQGRTGNGDIDDIFFGSAAERVVRLLPCPVLCVPQEVAGLEDEPKWNRVKKIMKLVCPNNCDAGRYENVGFRLVGVPITVMGDLTMDVVQIHSAVINVHKGLIPGAKILCGGCHQKASIEE